MPVNKSIEAELFLSRQLPALLQQHGTLETALEEINKHYKNITHTEINFDESLLVKYLRDSLSSNTTINNEVISTLSNQQKLTQSLSKEISTHFFQLGYYAAAVLVLTLVMSFIFLTFVLPSFADMFNGFGLPLPLLTQTMFDNSFLFAASMIIVIAYPLAAYSLAFNDFSTSIITRKNVRSLNLIAPGLARISLIIDELILTLKLQLELSIDVNKNIEGKMELIKSNKSAALSNNDLQHLIVAEKLKSVPTELDRIINLYEINLTNDLSKLKTVTSLSVLVFVGIFVGALVIAMYLPIFKLGTVV